MLSRVLRAEDIHRAQPHAWRRSDGQTNIPMRAAPVTPVSGARPESPFQPAGSEEQVRALQARIAELEASLERRIRETREAAYREGEAAGRNQGAAQVQPVIEKLAHSIHEIGELRPKLRHQAEGDLLQLALAIARKILHRELSADPDSIAGLIQVAVEKIRLQEIVRVRVNPGHLPVLQQILARISAGAQIEMQQDPKLPLGSVIVETTCGEFDASVELQLKEIERGLGDRLAKR